MIERWFTIPNMLEECANAEHVDKPENILKQTRQYIHGSTDIGEKTFGAFIKMIRSRPKRKALPSR
jgi:hypothetical protein